MSESPNPAIAAYGWQAVPRDIETLISKSAAPASGSANPIQASSISLPSSALAQKVREHAEKELAPETFNHSMRVYYYGILPFPFEKKRSRVLIGQAILQHAFPTWASESFNETYFLTCMMHDIGTTSKNLTSTLLSFEFYGGFLSLSLLKSLSSPVPQAESVAEAVIRHQDLGSTGTLTRIGALIQLATVFDNMGDNPELVHKETIESVVAEWPRNGWSGCFARTIRKENTLKPWAHTTHLGENDFPVGVENNSLMAPYDK
ncbi:Cyanamide hydratase [Lachnellula suecica]|uniref:Cyanamide hydratase n=1 Tax=Lachnellula suecica TaxID=602035 RepID=A0A8T9CC66_9HELO|nr:Cyanamide hydratase [Lachnellula suecica]